MSFRLRKRHSLDYFVLWARYQVIDLCHSLVRVCHDETGRYMEETDGNEEM